MAIPTFSLAAAAALLLYFVYSFVIYPTFLSPLAKIPNAHPTSPISPAWILWVRYRNRNNRTIHAAHQKHGPIVRVAPNEVSINCVDGGIRTVYAGGYEKHDWYPRQFGSYGYDLPRKMTQKEARLIKRIGPLACLPWYTASPIRFVSVHFPIYIQSRTCSRLRISVWYPKPS
jgi:hypothetical protein